MVNRIQGRLPIFLSGLMISALVGLGALRLSTYDGAAFWIGAGLVALYLVWLLVEARIAVSEIGKGETSRDRGTLELYALGRGLTVVTALAFPSFWEKAGPWLLLGPLLFVFGVGLRLIAIHTLGRFYSHRVRVANQHKIIDYGPYRFVRHPAYTGMLLAHVGFVLFFLNWVSLATVLVLFTPAVVARIRVEEQTLMTIEGYADYSKGRKRLAPLLW